MEIDGVKFPDKQVLLTNFELLRILQGHPRAARTSDGEEVTVRLPSADEFLEKSKEERAMKDQPGWSPPPPTTREKAEELTQPLREPWETSRINLASD